jgi:hypothetical protein
MHPPTFNQLQTCDVFVLATQCLAKHAAALVHSARQGSYSKANQ